MNPRTKLLLAEMSRHRSQKNIDGMERFGIVSKNVLGLTTPFIKAAAKKHKRDHSLALELWRSGIFEARILAAFIADPKQLKISIANQWVREFDNWAICDGVCIHCFRDTPYAHELIGKWVKRKEEFVRRAGFSMIATLAVNDKRSEDKVFLKYLPIIKKYSTDERNYVKKAVNWALRQIGKRNLKLNGAAIKAAKEIQRLDSSSAKWIAADALRELKGPQVQERLYVLSKRKKR
jgi:3-methyladenine DNA glycosylase AlkD